MEKLILKKIISIITGIFIFVFLASSISIVIIKNKSVDKDITEEISQIENFYKENLLNIELTKEFFKDDYLNRAYAIDYILTNNPEENLNNESLKKIKKIMEVELINIIDKNGVIVLGSNDESIGINLLNSTEAYPFFSLIKGKDQDGKVVQLDAISTLDKKEKIYIGVESNLEEYSVIQIGLDRSTFDDLIKAYSIEFIMNNAPTTYEKTFFVANKNTGILEGITKNNEQNMVFEGVNSNEEFRDKLYELTSTSLVKINNKYRYIKTKIVDDHIIGVYRDAEGVFSTLLVYILYLILFTLLAFLVVITIVKFSIKKYVLKDIFSIRKNIKELIDGNYNVEFKTEYDTELKEISQVLNDWKDSYKYKTERMTRILSAVNTQSAVFECLYVLNKNFFSDNTQEILGLDDETWREISKRPEDFENYINSINAKGGIVNINNKFLNIVSFKKEDEFYGMIMDKTDD